MANRSKQFNLIHYLRNEASRSNRSNVNRSTYLQHRFDTYSELYSQDAKGHSGCVNALDFSSDGLLLATGGDDKRVLIWNMAETLFSETNRTPVVLNASHLSNIFSVKFDNQTRRIISAGNDEHILVHDIEKQRRGFQGDHAGGLIDAFLEASPINCLSIQPQHNDVFIAATEDGHVHLYDLRSASSAAGHDQPSIIAESLDGSYHSCAFHPQQTCLVATANARQGIELYDIRLSKSSVLRYGAPASSAPKIATSDIDNIVEGMSVSFNSDGSLLYALRRRLPPVLFKLHQPRAFCQFDADNYVNICTMKSGCFVGDRDQYVASGSDDFNLYIWRIPDNENDSTLPSPSSSHLSSDHFVWNAHMVLQGHRSVVNQVRYSPRLHTIVSSGVEKIVKMWTPYHTRNNSPNRNTLHGRPEMYSHRDYLRAVLESGSVHHDSSDEGYDEDTRMLAFFDSLLQRELGNGHDDSDDDSDDLSSIIDSTDDDDDFLIRSNHSDDETEVRITLEEINSQTADLGDSVIHSSHHPSDSASSQPPHPTIVSLAKSYRIRYLQMLKEVLDATPSSHTKKRALDSPTTTSVLKRQRSSSSFSSTLQTLRSRIENEENEQFCFNDERRL